MMADIRTWRGFTLAAAMLAIASPAQAQEGWSGTMSGAQEVPANASPATGFAFLSLTGNFLTVDVFWSALIGGPATAAHIHCCVLPGSNAGVAIGFPGFPLVSSGSYTNTFNLLDPAVYAAAFRNTFGGGTAAGAKAALIAGLDAGRAYVNIHNSTFPGGELRANVTAIPEPASLGLMATGLIAIAGLRWTRRRHA